MIENISNKDVRLWCKDREGLNKTVYDFSDLLSRSEFE
jgi:hypothetical protein